MSRKLISLIINLESNRVIKIEKVHLAYLKSVILQTN